MDDLDNFANKVGIKREGNRFFTKIKDGKRILDNTNGILDRKTQKVHEKGRHGGRPLAKGGYQCPFTH